VNVLNCRESRVLLCHQPDEVPRLPLPGWIILIVSGRYVSLIVEGAGQVAIRSAFSPR